MKKWLCFLGTVICFTFCALSVRADVIWEPENSFYEKNASKCTYVGRCFTANGPDGVVIIYESPESPRVITTWENGFKVYIFFTYEDENGVLWGIYDDFKQSGWMPMDYMEVVYDHISFEEEYGGEIKEQSGVLEEQYRGKDVCLWNYPGAEEPSYVMSLTMPELPKYNSVYVDEKGYSWGWVGYYYGHRNVWVCIDRPMADYGQLYPEGGPEIGQKETVQTKYQSGNRIVPGEDNGAMAVAAVLVLLVVLVTAALLVILKRKTGDKA